MSTRPNNLANSHIYVIVKINCSGWDGKLPFVNLKWEWVLVTWHWVYVCGWRCICKLNTSNRTVSPINDVRKSVFEGSPLYVHCMYISHTRLFHLSLSSYGYQFGSLLLTEYGCGKTESHNVCHWWVRLKVIVLEIRIHNGSLRNLVTYIYGRTSLRQTLLIQISA